MEDYRFDALISDRQVEGDRSLKVSNEPAIWGERPLAKATKKKKSESSRNVKGDRENPKTSVSDSTNKNGISENEMLKT